MLGPEMFALAPDAEIPVGLNARKYGLVHLIFPFCLCVYSLSRSTIYSSEAWSDARQPGMRTVVGLILVPGSIGHELLLTGMYNQINKNKTSE